MTLYMPFFNRTLSSRTLTQLHAHLIVNGHQKSQPAATKLIESYANMGHVESARIVFQNFKNPDSFMWGVLIKCHVWSGLFREAILLYNEMLGNFTQVSSFVFPSTLRACSGIGDLGVGEMVHGRIVKCGLQFDLVIQTSLLSMYGETGCLRYARSVFEDLSVRDLVLWSSIISSHVQNGEESEGVDLFREMVGEGVEPDSVVMLSVAEACAELGLWREGKSVHGYVVRNAILSDGALDSSLITMYGKCGDLHSAEGIFNNVVHLSTATWTSMITCYNQCGCYREVIDIFSKMLLSNGEPNAVTMMGVLRSCVRLGWLKEGRSVHGFVIRKIMDPEYNSLVPSLVDLYATSGNTRCAHKILFVSRERHIVSWNLLISRCIEEGSKEALTIFRKMQSYNISPDSFTLATMLSACGKFGLLLYGRQIHGHVIRTSCPSEFVLNSLIDMYAKCGFVDSAYLVFKNRGQGSVVTWNSMICGFCHNGFSAKAISLFDQMYSKSLEMDAVTFLSVIQACSNLGYLEKGKWIHHKLITTCLQDDTYINTALLDMYAKCGDLYMARGIFDTMSERTVVSWSAMIGGYGSHGQIDLAISLFNRMVESEVKPNEVTFMNILSACSHAGYVEVGKSYFNLMKDFGAEPQLEHYACLIDLLSRGGNLDEAYMIIDTMPFQADASNWGALLNGCRIHRRVDMIQKIQEKLLGLDMDDTGYYTLLSNVFAEGGDWGEFSMVRSLMNGLGLKKCLGMSKVEIDTGVHGN
ncbi:hypothetical protein DCAR_0832085 [Daucus carota subsp. sativus]|uniref:Pentacotripeptide-repeat region of PRORP domain-containing protein n=1 Tax=Daucus carota subsp. sativus TaxID=79200 RepID=A0AAF0XRF1_DAUCS|nr:PREDICTED: putative pentatricopeptide repeat-containing protein At1g69350, mitochondrial [Daucus carota subsp. sativus]XP_017220089.1 PREDICTED: putative pentatricopeptide repeat-containing protein At1g69350, mitochondrial [Daucus carota subsp. sativus]XP_017220090.1 PREDICTED: putative pentatricopeptide repeat-containing protein At1g69350, mitochondrial [Daucus carota subsp. sativus]XP_017220091.1 PREDICTED: putative pentatricopeptide repeat-containing protein At1g69350, mitochondrial [Daucu